MEYVLYSKDDKPLRLAPEHKGLLMEDHPLNSPLGMWLQRELLELSPDEIDSSIDLLKDQFERITSVLSYAVKYSDFIKKVDLE